MKLRVLVVEDDPMVLDVLAALLGFEELEVVTASDGPVGLELAQRIEPDVVVLDINLPGMDGLQVARAIRQTDQVTRIVMLSANTSQEAELEVAAAGADHFVRKPFSPLELLEAVGVGDEDRILR